VRGGISVARGSRVDALVSSHAGGNGAGTTRRREIVSHYAHEMTDHLVVFATIACLIAVLYPGARMLTRRRASASSRVWTAVACALLAVSLTAVGVYQLSKSRTMQIAGSLVHHVDTRQKMVAVTFDDGPTPGNTERVLDILHSRGASATFYLTGVECRSHPELVRRIAEEGHEIGNHTFSHKRLVLLPDSRIAEEIESTDAAIRAAGYRGPITFRPPGCKRLVAAPLYLARTGRTTVTWDLEPDSIPSVESSPGAIIDDVMGQVRPGDIIELHVMYPSREPTIRALPELLRRLSHAGYRMVTVSELMGSR
jgi:peptidoglycan-N-acetylglucosamine deacetylase